MEDTYLVYLETGKLKQKTFDKTEELFDFGASIITRVINISSEETAKQIMTIGSSMIKELNSFESNLENSLYTVDELNIELAFTSEGKIALISSLEGTVRKSHTIEMKIKKR